MAVGLSEYSGIFLRKIVKKVTEAIPYFGIIQDKVAMSAADQIGEKFMIPTVLTLEQGVTYSKSGNGAFALNASIDGKVAFAEAVGSQIAIRSTIADEAIVSSQSQDRAIEQALDRVAKLNSISHKKRLEIALIHGQMPKAIVESVATLDITFTAASWCGAMWSGMVGASVEFFPADYASKDVTTTITAVNNATRTISVASATSIAATHVIQFTGAVVANATPSLVVWHEMAGLKKILSNVGTLFGIAGGTYDVWCGNLLNGAASGTAEWLSYLMLEEARGYALDKGGEDPEYIALIGVKQFSHLQSDEASNRQYDSSYSRQKGETGFNRLLYAAPGGGTIEPIAHPYMWPSEALLFTWEELRRPGAQDFCFNMNGGVGEGRWDPEGKYVLDLQDAMGKQIKSYSHGCIFHELPGHGCYIYGLKVA